MICGLIPSCARPVLFAAPVIAAVIAGAIPAARSQDRATQDRLERLERDLTLLQRQYRGGGPNQIPGGPAGSAVDTELRMDRLETQMRELTGRIEDAVNGVEQVRRRVEQINSDLDVRLGQGLGQPKGAPSNSHAAAGVSDAGPAGPIAMRSPAPVVSPNPRPSPSLMPPGTLVPSPRDPPAGMGTLTPPGRESTNVATAGSFRPPVGGPPVGGPPAGGPPVGGGPLRGDSASEHYNNAYGLLKRADYPAAEEAFRAFVGRYPNDPLAGSAQYWLGETFFARGQYAEAATAFAEGYKRFPKGTKAADDLLKLGMSLARASQKQNACVALAQLDRDFPNPGSAIKGQAVAEKKRLGC
jgi:tol-pal system protein YbgF